MSPRPRKVSDEQVFMATVRVMQRLGPGEITLADIAAEAGLTAGALVQRFGSKRQLLLALSSLWSGGVGDMFAGLRARHRSPLAAVRAWADGMAGMGESPDTLARSLSYLLVDLTDPEFYRHTLAGSRATRAELRKLLGEAVRAGELRAPGGRAAAAAALARALDVTVSGSLMTWAIHREGSARAAVRRDVEFVLAPWLGRTSGGADRRRPSHPSPRENRA